MPGSSTSINLAGTVTRIDPGTTTGSQDVSVEESAGTIGHLVVSLGGLPLPVSVGDSIQTQALRSPGFQYGTTLIVTRNNQTIIYMATSEDGFAAPPVPLAMGDTLCSVPDSCGVITQNSLLALDGTTMVSIGQGQARDVGAFRVLNDGSRVHDGSKGTCQDWSGRYFHVAIVRTMP